MSGGSPIRSGSHGSWRTFQSTGLTPAAATRTRISVGAGSGRPASCSSRTSGPPCSCITIACTRSVSLGDEADVAPTARDSLPLGRRRFVREGPQALLVLAERKHSGSHPALPLLVSNEEGPAVK